MISNRVFWDFSLILGFLTLWPLLPSPPTAPALDEPEEGAIVEEITKGSAAEKAGLLSGDLLLSWSREDGNNGPVRSPFDLDLLEIDQAPRGAVTLHGMRKDISFEWTLPLGLWGIKAKPTFPEAADQGQAPLRAAWLQDRLARELDSNGRLAEADAVWERTVQRLEGSQPATAAQLLRNWSTSLERRNLWDRAEGCYRRALALEQKESLTAAFDLAALGDIASHRGDLSVAESLYLKAYAIAERLAPGSIQLAMGLTSLGKLAVAQGDLLIAEERFQQALYLFEQLEPNGTNFAQTLANLGTVNMNRGDLATAEERLRRALAIQEELIPESLDVALTLNHLGRLAERRGDSAAAEDHHRRALHITEKLAHGTPHTSYESIYNLWNLAAVERRKGDLAKADEYLQRIMGIAKQISPESLSVAMAYFYRALFAVERGNLSLAQELHGRALPILEKQTPGSLLVSDSLDSLGGIALERGDLPKAEELFQHALKIRDRLAPSSTRLGMSLNNLGRVYRRMGRLEMAAEHFCRATEAFDTQRKALGGTIEGSFAFGGTTAEHYRDCLAALLDIGRPEEAVRVLERGRARSFLDLLAERDLRWSADLPPELARDHKQINSEYDRTQGALERLSPVRDQAEIDRLLVRLRELRARQEDLTSKIRQVSPRAAAVHDPKPLDLAGTRAALDPGTVLLAWSIGQERSFLFVIQPMGTNPEFEVLPLAVGDQALRKRVGSFLNLLQRADSDRATLSRQARELYDILLRPGEPRIASAQRILVAADGPLHTLPFAALIRNGRWLAEEKPIHSVLSATVYAELKKARRPAFDRVQSLVVAFGNPVYPRLPKDRNTAPAATLEILSAIRRGLSLRPLPASRREVEAIANLFPEARTYMGSEATEERAKTVSSQAQLLHFACHGLLDERFPLNSALALTIPENPGEGQDNGLLQAWEIFENVRLDADLVTLSACDTALGQEMGGEGLLGLTRAFQYAGARSVLASLWSVSDASTADLMKRFYGYLSQGRSKDEALRAAQADLIRSQDFSHPYYWAAFQLTGDWR